MTKLKAFLQRKNIVISAKRYGIDALGAMAQGLFCSLLIGTIIKTLGEQLGVEMFVTIGGFASAMSGAAMATAIGYALQAPPLVLFSLAAVGYAANQCGGAGGPLAVLIIAILAAEIGKMVSKETKIDILVTPLVTIFVGCALSMWWAPAIGAAALLDGHSGICGGRYCSDPAYLQCGHLRVSGPGGPGRRCCCGGLLREYGWFCCDELQRE